MRFSPFQPTTRTMSHIKKKRAYLATLTIGWLYVPPLNTHILKPVILFLKFVDMLLWKVYIPPHHIKSWLHDSSTIKCGIIALQMSINSKWFTGLLCWVILDIVSYHTGISNIRHCWSGGLTRSRFVCPGYDQTCFWYRCIRRRLLRIRHIAVSTPLPSLGGGGAKAKDHAKREGGLAATSYAPRRLFPRKRGPSPGEGKDVTSRSQGCDTQAKPRQTTGGPKLRLVLIRAYL